MVEHARTTWFLSRRDSTGTEKLFWVSVVCKSQTALPQREITARERGEKTGLRGRVERLELQ
jgi:hypothetical protein